MQIIWVKKAFFGEKRTRKSVLKAEQSAFKHRYLFPANARFFLFRSFPDVPAIDSNANSLNSDLIHSHKALLLPDFIHTARNNLQESCRL